MKKGALICIAVSLHLLISNLSFARGKMKIAVLNFKDTGISREFASFVEGLPNMLLMDLGKSKKIIVVERGKIDKAFKNFRIEKNQYFDQSTAIKIGRWLGADAVIFGNFSAVQEKVRIDARIINIKTGSLVESPKVSGTKNTVHELIDLLSVKILKALTGESPLPQIRKGKLMDEEFELNFETLKPGSRLTDQVFYSYEDKIDPSITFKLLYDSLGRGKADAQGSNTKYYNEDVLFKIWTGNTGGPSQEIGTVSGAKYNKMESAGREIGNYEVKLKVTTKTVIEYRDLTSKSGTDKISCIMKLVVRISVNYK